jgi:hypothetical protein
VAPQAEAAYRSTAPAPDRGRRPAPPRNHNRPRAGPLGRGLEFDLIVHLWLSPSALRRRTTGARRWTLPACERYESEVSPSGLADVVVRVDDPEHPAVVDAW